MNHRTITAITICGIILLTRPKPRRTSVLVLTTPPRENAMSCYRCSTCSRDWPLINTYSRCPDCNTPCWLNDSPAMTDQEANSIRNHLAFEKYYQQREHERLATERDLIIRRIGNLETT